MPTQTQPRINRLRRPARKQKTQQQPAQLIAADNQVATMPVLPAAAVATESAPQSRYKMPPMAEVLDRYPDVKGIRRECGLIPPMSNLQFDSLVCSTKELGQLLDPIRLDESGNLIVGRDELAACHLLGITPRFEITDLDPLKLVIARLAGPHPTRDQLAATAVRLMAFERKRAAKRQKTGLKRGAAFPVCQDPDTREGRASTIVARKLGLSRYLVERASKLPDDLLEQVARGVLRISAAEETLTDQKTKGSEVEPPTEIADIVSKASPSSETCAKQGEADQSAKTKPTNKKVVKQSNVDTTTKKVVDPTPSAPKTLLDCDDVTVIQMPDSPEKVIIHGPVNGKWIRRLTKTGNQQTFDSKADAIAYRPAAKKLRIPKSLRDPFGG